MLLNEVIKSTFYLYYNLKKKLTKFCFVSKHYILWKLVDGSPVSYYTMSYYHIARANQS